MDMVESCMYVRTYLRKLIITIFVCSFLNIPTVANAEGFYIGANVGTSELSDFDSVLSGSGFTGNVDDEDTGFKIFIGNQFNPNFALEGGFVDFGEATADGVIFGIPITASIEADAFFVSAVGILPVGERFSVFGRAGVFLWDATASASAFGLSDSFSDDGTDLAFGAGAQFNITDKVGIRGEWEVYDLDDTDIDLLSLGIIIYLQ